MTNQAIVSILLFCLSLAVLAAASPMGMEAVNNTLAMQEARLTQGDVNSPATTKTTARAQEKPCTQNYNPLCHADVAQGLASTESNSLTFKPLSVILLIVGLIMFFVSRRSQSSK